MKKPLTDEDLLHRASVDGRVAFAAVAFALAAGLVALVDRVGAPERVVLVLGPTVVLAGLCVVGLLLQAMRVSRFYAAGRAVRPQYAALAFAALAAGLFLPFLPPTPRGASVVGVLTGFGLGLAIAAFVTGPLLRKTGAFSLPDLVAGRFDHVGVRLGMVVVAAAIALCVAAAGFESAVRALSASLGLSRAVTASLAAGVVLLLTAPGGVGGVVWGASGAAGTFAASLILPVAALAFSGAPLPLPAFGRRDLWNEAVTRIAAWHGTSSNPFDGDGWLLIVVVALGVGALGPLLTPAIATPNAASARRSGALALGWLAVFSVAVAAAMAMSALAMEALVAGQRPEGLPAFVYAASGAGLVGLCGEAAATPQAAVAACRLAPGFAGVLRPSDLWVAGEFLLTGLPAARGFTVAFSGLASAGVIALALVVAAAGVQAFATAVAHDGLYRVRDAAALTSRRLAATRLFTIALSVTMAWAATGFLVEPQQVTSLAIAFSAAIVAPLLLLCLWPRASGPDAAMALLAGLLVAGAVIASGGGAPGIGLLAAAALAAFVVTLATGVGMSLRHGAEVTRPGRIFLEGVLHGDADLMDADRGV